MAGGGERGWSQFLTLFMQPASEFTVRLNQRYRYESKSKTLKSPPGYKSQEMHFGEHAHREGVKRRGGKVALGYVNCQQREGDPSLEIDLEHV